MDHSPSVRLRLTRRDWLSATCAGMVGLPAVIDRLARPAQAGSSIGAATGRAKSVILILLTGGASHQDTFDLKPQAPEGIRGEFKPIDTSVAGLQICEHLPLLAARARQYALIRSMSHTEGSHLPGTHKTLTGRVMPLKRDSDLDNVLSRRDWPCYAAAYDAIRPRTDGVPNGVTLPHRLIEGPLTWPGQHGGFMGAGHDPWQITQDPNSPTFRDDSLHLPAGVTIERLNNRESLLREVDQQRARLEGAASEQAFADQHSAAFNLLTSGKVSQAFDMDREPASVRDRYGRHMFGQSLLLARRLVQVGVPIVQANMGIVQTWDTHDNNFVKLKDRLLPPLDRGVSALLDDLAATGLLDETLVLMVGEFGRTPKISLTAGATIPGRDHWPQVYSAFFAGAGVQGGQVIGKSDDIGAYPVTRSYTPEDLGTTIFDALGLPASTEFHDKLGRPIQLATGQVIESLYSGA
ncbi:MAG: DUF1501 domain-containing protein [Planctomycetes bacterium]|nr:DUF1501 domain-containing protein [Planctomycetota bacterium]